MSRKEQRRDRRYGLPVLYVWIGVDRYATRDWSLGGFLLEAAPAVDVGGRIVGRLQIEGCEEFHDVTAEAVWRADAKLGCRFVEPTAELLAALDAAIAARLLGRRPKLRPLKLGGLGLVALLAAAQTGLAAGTVVGSGGVTLVPGGAPLPEFRLNFPNLLTEPPDLPRPDGSNLQISVTTPGKGVLQFLFSPRAQFDVITDRDTGTSRSYAGVSWNLFENNGFFGSLGFSGSLTRPGAEEMYRRYLGPPLALHSTFEFGYQLGASHSLTLQLDHASTPDFQNDRNELNNFRLEYGVKF